MQGLQVDTGLAYSSSDLGEILKSFARIEDNGRKLTLEPYPDKKVLAAFAQLAYSDCAGELHLPEGWHVLTTAQNNRWLNGYFGCAFWNPSQQQIVIAHRGTANLGSFWIDGKGVYLNKYTAHMSSAVSFGDVIKTLIRETNRRYRSHLRLSIAGHSLGGWLAGVTTLTVKYLKRKGSGFCRIASPGEGLHAHTLTLDSPGVEDMLMKICRDYDERYDRFMSIKQLDITAFFAAANLVNSTGYHVGGIYQMHIKRDALSRFSKGPTLIRNIHTHSLEHFITAFEEGKEIYTVQDWPQGKTECKVLHKLERHCNSYILRPDAEQVPEPVKGNNDPEHEEETANTHYRTELSLGNTCHLGVFSMTELKFLQNWSLFQSHTIMKPTEIDQFVSRKHLDKLVFPRFEMDTRRNTITCETKKHLEKVIGQTKQLLHWFPEIMGALSKQNRSIKLAPLYLAGQAFLCTLPDILDCEDTVGLEPFMASSEQRVLQIQTSDGKFAATRLYNILINLKNPSLEITYLNKNCHTFLGWNIMASIAKDMHIEDLMKAGVTNFLLVLASQTDNLRNDIFSKILRNLEKCSHKKLVVILSQQIDSQLFNGYNLNVETKAFELFDLSDLTLKSREEILTRDSIVLGEKTLSLNLLLGDDCKSNDEQVRNKINKIISPILKELATNYRHIAEIPNKLPRLCELDALYSKCNKHVSKEGLVALLKRTGSVGPLVVISDSEQLSQDYWGEVAEAAWGRIFISAINGHDLFLEKCRKKPARIIYWFHLCSEGLTLKEVYNGGIYISRKFHTRFIIKSVDAFFRYNGNKDLFIFNNVEDKSSLISSFELSMEAVQLFVSADHFKILHHSEEMNTDDKKIEQSLAKHFFKLLKIRGSPCLVWQYSHGSLEGLRPFIARDYSDPIEEGAFYNTKKKLVIIADDAGVGKTTSLTRMTELIQGYWVLRIDHKHLTSAVDTLPSKLTLQSVTDCLIHASGLPPNKDFVRGLLLHCLESDNSRQVCVLVDAFDEITEEKTMGKMVELLKYLKNSTTCKTVVTTRVYRQEGLENDLAEFSAELEKITEREQDDYMVNFWLPHLALELPKYGEPEKGRLRRFARELREEMEGVLGDDVASFMGIPLQIRMLADVFLQRAIRSVVSSEQVTNFNKITNLFDLYKQFIEVKKTIYFEQKTNIKESGLPHNFQNILVRDIMEIHYILAFQMLDPRFFAEYFTNKIPNDELMDISRLGLIRSNTNGTFIFIHRTFEEYLCADFVVKWIRQGSQPNEKNRLVKNELSKFLLRPDYYIIRKFIETQLDTPPIPGNALEKIPTDVQMYQHWCEHRQLFFHDHDKTPLHVAAEEQNEHTVEVLLSGPISRSSEEAYISFIAARDKGGRTALNIALEKENFNIVNQIKENIVGCSYESLLELLLATFLDAGGERDDDLFREYCSHAQQLTSKKNAFRRFEEIRKQFTPFIAAVRSCNYETVQMILSDMESDTERAYLKIGIDSQGNTAINLATREKHNMLFKLFAKQGVCVSHDGCGQNPLHCAAEEGHTSIVKYLLNQSKETYESITKTLPITIDNDNHQDENEATTVQNDAKYYTFSQINSKDNNGDTALSLAASGGHDEVVSALLQHDGNLISQSNIGTTVLQSSVNSGNHEKLCKLLQNVVDIHSTSKIGRTALISAGCCGHLNVVKLLLQNGADMNFRDKSGDSVLLLAARNGHLSIVCTLLEKGADIHTRNNKGWTALCYAACHGHLEVVDLLLVNEDDFNFITQDDYFPLALAATNGHHDTVRKLLEKGADIHTRNNRGWTALCYAACHGHLEVVDLLLVNGGNLNFITQDNYFPLALAATNGHHDTVRKLLEKGADIHIRNNKGWTALCYAACHGHLEVVDLLLVNGGDLNFITQDNYFLLGLAATNGHHDTVRKLLEKGADIHTRDNKGWTALCYAACHGHLEVVDLLLVNGGDLNFITQDNYFLLGLAATNGHHDTVRKLLENGADIHTRDNKGWTALCYAACHGHLEIVDLLLVNEGDLNFITQDDYFPLALAANQGHHYTVRKLLEKGADIHTRNNKGWTALRFAVNNGHLEIVNLLLHNGADFNSRDESGDSALLLAAANGHANIVTLLLQLGVDVNSQRDDGRTALSWAAHNGQLHTLEVLLQHKANVSSQDKEGKTALSWAEENGHQEIVDLLLRHQEAIPDESETPIV